MEGGGPLDRAVLIARGEEAQADLVVHQSQRGDDGTGHERARKDAGAGDPPESSSRPRDDRGDEHGREEEHREPGNGTGSGRREDGGHPEGAAHGQRDQEVDVTTPGHQEARAGEGDIGAPALRGQQPGRAEADGHAHQGWVDVEPEGHQQAHAQDQPGCVGIGQGARQPPQPLRRHGQGEPAPDQSGEAGQGTHRTEARHAQRGQLPGSARQGPRHHESGGEGEHARPERQEALGRAGGDGPDQPPRRQQQDAPGDEEPGAVRRYQDGGGQEHTDGGHGHDESSGRPEPALAESRHDEEAEQQGGEHPLARVRRGLRHRRPARPPSVSPHVASRSCRGDRRRAGAAGPRSSRRPGAIRRGQNPKPAMMPPLSGVADMLPRKGALPKENTSPRAEATHKPRPSLVGKTAVAGSNTLV